MKMLICLMTLLASLNAFAQFSTKVSKSFIYDGSQNSVELVLKADKTHYEYHYETRTTTCYRDETVWTTHCSHGYRPGPYGRPIPGPPICHQVPHTRRVIYTCMQREEVRTEHKDYDVEARVIVDVTKLSPEATPGEKIIVTLDNGIVQASAVGSKKFFIVNKKEEYRGSMQGSVMMIDGLVVAELIEAAPVLKAVKMSDIALNGSELNFTVGQAETRANIGFSLKVEHKKLFGSDTVLFNRELAQAEVAVNDTKASVDINKLGVELESGKYELTAKTFVKVDGQLMNSDQFDSLSASKTLVYKIR